MKQTLTILGLLAILSLPVAAQTTNSPSSTTNLFDEIYNLGKEAVALGTSNFTIAPYGEYAPKAAVKWGGGVIYFFNPSPYVGVGVGGDWLGQYTAFGASLSLHATLHPLSFLGGFATNITVTPYALTTVGTSTGGANGDNGSGMGSAGGGAALYITSIGGICNLAVQGGYQSVINAGPYSGPRWVLGPTLHFIIPGQ
jgi:hypothetical protein